MTLGGSMFTHGFLSYDYCLKESLRSLLDVCDQVVVVDAASTDGTRDYLEYVALTEPKLFIVTADWNPVPGDGGAWLRDLANKARCALNTDYHIMLHPDEVISPNDYQEIRRLTDEGTAHAFITRLNFWKDARHWCHCGGVSLCRLAPTSAPVMQDAGNLDETGPQEHTGIMFYHYGALRRTESLIRKVLEQEHNIIGSDEALMAKLGKGGSHILVQENAREKWDNFYNGDLVEFTGEHPPIMQEWLAQRGYSL